MQYSLKIALQRYIKNSKQHWSRLWLGAISEQALAWAKADQDLCRHMVSLWDSELTYPICWYGTNV